MAGEAKRILFSHLKELTEDELKHFQSLLDQRLATDGEPKSPKRWVKKSKYMAIVRRLVQQYGEEQALEVAVDLFGQVSRQQLSEQLLQASQTYLDQRRYEKQEKDWNVVMAVSRESPIAETICSLIKVDDSARSEELAENATPLSVEDPPVVAYEEAGHRKKYIEDLIQSCRLQEEDTCFGECLDLKDRFPKLVTIKNYCQVEGREHEILSGRKKHQEVWVQKTRNSYSEVTDLFETCQNGHTPRIVVLQGAAGIGKTTLARKIILDWASGKLYQGKFDYAFYIHCRNIDQHHTPQSVGDLLVCSCSEMAKCTLGLLDDPTRLLFIIDGFDELRCPLLVSEDEHPSTVDTQSALLRKTLLCKSSLLITTRTTALEKLRKCVKVQHLKEIIGFSQEDIEDYFNCFFRNIKPGEQTFQTIQEKTDLSMCFVPIVCWIVCRVIKQYVERGEEFTRASNTMTLVYLSFLDSVLIHQTSESINHMHCTLKRLCALAKDGVHEKKILFEEEDIRRYGLTFSDIQSILQNEVTFHKAAKDQNLFSFVHLSFQEFLAALSYILRENDEVSERTDRQPDLMELLGACRKPNQKHLLLTVRFVFGLLNPKAMNQMEETLKWKIASEIKADLLLWIKERINENGQLDDQMMEHLYCLYETKDEDFAKGALEHLKTVESAHFCQLMDKLDFGVLLFCLENSAVIQQLHISNYKMEPEEMRALVPWTVESSSLHFWECSLSAACCRELSAVLSKSGNLKELVLGYNQILDPGVAQLCEGLRRPGCNLQKLDMCNCSLTGSCCADLASVLRTTSSLEELILADNALGDFGVSQLCEGLQDPQCKLKKLDLDDCSLTGSCCGDLASALSANQSLTELSLRGNKLGDTGMSQLCEWLKHHGCSVQNLDLLDCALTGSCCADISLALCTNTSLTELRLSRNELGDSGVIQLCQGLKHPGCRLQRLWLLQCSLKGSCCADLASVLRTSPSLTELSLSDNELGDSGVSKLCQGLKDPGCKLQKLDLWCCSFTASCCADLASALIASPNLTELILSDNKLEDSGMKYLCEGLKHPSCKLQKLELDTAGLTDACVVDLCSTLSENRTLQSLSLNCNHFTDASIASFLQLKTNCSNLCDISLLGNDFSAQGREALRPPTDKDE